MVSDWLESCALLVQSKTSGMWQKLFESISSCALEILTFIAWIQGPALWLFSKYVDVMEE